VYRLIDLLLYNVDLQSVPILFIGWTGLVLSTVCLMESLLGIVLDHPYDRGLAKNFFWMIWYPVVYWMLVASTSVCALPALLLRRTGERAKWISPDRGLSPEQPPKQ
jgi:biofilm PGA synthesis N-glycosyltransferase PgaC